MTYIPTLSKLVPGEVVVTGTTGGVGARRTPPFGMQDGDTIGTDISGIDGLGKLLINEEGG